MPTHMNTIYSKYDPAYNNTYMNQFNVVAYETKAYDNEINEQISTHMTYI